LTTRSTSDDLHKRVRDDFQYHPADAAKGVVHEEVRGELENVAHTIIQVCPEGRELSLALTKLEEAMFWANAAIARRE
jgi:divalent metal cation (Fe/Co/Zn/Cd) transporter